MSETVDSVVKKVNLDLVYKKTLSTRTEDINLEGIGLVTEDDLVLGYFEKTPGRYAVLTGFIKENSAGLWLHSGSRVINPMMIYLEGEYDWEAPFSGLHGKYSYKEDCEEYSKVRRKFGIDHAMNLDSETGLGYILNRADNEFKIELHDPEKLRIITQHGPEAGLIIKEIEE